MREALGVTETGATLPPFLRLPRSGERCPVSGFSRSYSNLLILGEAPEVESIVVRKPGKVRGIRLVSTESLLGFIRSQGTHNPANVRGGDEVNSPARIHPTELIIKIVARCTEAPAPYDELDEPCLLYRGTPGRLNPFSGGSYARVHDEGRQMLVHHVMWEAANGTFVPEDLIIRHRCDRPDCCRPSHLLTGTTLDNMRDAGRRNRRAYGERNGSQTHPERVPRGEKHRGAKITEQTAALIKGALHAMGDGYGVATSVAAYYHTTPSTVRNIARGKTWTSVDAITPDPLPPIIARHRSESFPLSRRAVVLTPEAVADIRYRYHAAGDREKVHLKAELAKDFGVSVPTIRSVLERKTHKEIAPEIPTINERGSGRAVLSDREIQEIRATYDKHLAEHPKGLEAALARHFRVSIQQIIRIVERESRLEIEDDPDAFLPIEELPLKPLNRAGEEHPLARLTDAKVREMHRLTGEGVSRKDLSNRFGITKENVGTILRGQTWKHIYRELHSHTDD
ncbi:MAG TPA: HNH endonuclease [Bacteroidia bacterium]|nr:HNH endonuclease [Bacteroidia bacterium]